MILHSVRAHKSADRLRREDQLAWKLAGVAADAALVDDDVAEMIGNRVIDNAAVALASVNRPPILSSRAQAAVHPDVRGATLFGAPAALRVSPEWAAWANGVAVRELDFHDTFLAADYSHPGDNIPPILAVAQRMGKDGAALTRAIAAAYEIHVALVKGICLHEYKIDHITHLAPAAAAGIGALLGLDQETIYQAIGQAIHTTTTTRQSRKGEISSWKAYAPAFAGKMAIEAVDRAMRGEGAPAPIYEGEDGLIAWLLSGWDKEYHVPLPARGEAKRQIMETYTKEHSAEYQAQAIIDLARRMGALVVDWDSVREIVLLTSHHTHNVIGTGANDPQKMDPQASRETLDHSIMYILAVALQDRAWHHVNSYLPARAQRPDTVRLWHKIRTVEDAAWTAAYHDPDPDKKRFGGRLEIYLDDGRVLIDKLGVADAHPAGARPFARAQYVEKFHRLTDGICDAAEQRRFLDLAARLPTLSAREALALNPVLQNVALQSNRKKGIFDAE